MQKSYAHYFKAGKKHSVVIGPMTTPVGDVIKVANKKEAIAVALQHGAVR